MNGAAVVGLSFDGTDIQHASIGIFLEIVSGLYEVPEVRGTDTTVPGRTGRIARNRKSDHWLIQLEGYVAGTGIDEAQQREHFLDLADQLRGLFDPTAMPATLQAETQDGGTRTIEARTLGIVYEQIVPSMARLGVRLEAVEDWVVTVAGS